MAVPVAILIVNYRVYRHVDRALTSLRSFLRPDDEVVLVDHASDPVELAALQSRHPAVTFLPSSANPGFAAGVNRAARASRSPHLLWLNPDTELAGPVLDGLEAWLCEHPDTAVVGPRVLDPDGRVDASARRFPGPTAAIAGRSTWLTRRYPNNWLSRRNLPAREATAAMDVDWLAGACLMTRRDVFEQLGGLDEEFFLYWEDADYCRRATDAGWRCVYLPTVSVRHVGGRSAAADPAPAIRAFHRSAVRLLWKHGGRGSRLLLPIVGPAMVMWGEFRARLRRRGLPSSQ
ncbi:MAG: glycosyltransferase family 2 protein [Acidobacteria bacterium]|nr:glycosyltransferase family 2 protein [Acidobacteriota bacterium]